MKIALLPNNYKRVGWILFIPFAILGILSTFGVNFKIPFYSFAIWYHDLLEPVQLFSLIKIDMYNTIIGSVLLISLLILAFSKEKDEDEYVERVRYESMLWAILINYLLLLIALIFVYGLAFQTVMIYNMFTALLIFVLRLNIVLFFNRRSLQNEE